MWPFKKKKPVAPITADSVPGIDPPPEKDIYIMTGTHRGFDGLSPDPIPGFPLTKTNTARKPRPFTNEIECNACDGEGWDANSGGGVFICPECKGTGVVDGSAVCECGHNKTRHYLGYMECRGDKRRYDEHGCWCAGFKNDQEDRRQFSGPDQIWCQDGWKRDESGKMVKVDK